MTHSPWHMHSEKLSSFIQTYYNTGNMIYAFTGSAGLFFLIFGGLLFLLFWEPTSEYLMLLLAWGVGLVSRSIMYGRLTPRLSFYSLFPWRIDCHSLGKEYNHSMLYGAE